MNSKLTWNKPKRQASLVERSLDFADANQFFASATFEYEGTRENYGEKRMICFGYLYPSTRRSWPANGLAGALRRYKASMGSMTRLRFAPSTASRNPRPQIQYLQVRGVYTVV